MLDFQRKTAIIKSIKKKAVKILYTDIFGKTRVKLGLHQHTTRSDGVLSPQEMTALYRESGYDAVAITDHWVYSPVEDFAGIRSLGGAEYHVGNRDAGEGIFHILCLFADREPALAREGATAQGIIDAIHDAGGLAVLGHPAWSLNSLSAVAALRNLDGVEIFNTVSKWTGRADASLLIDIYATAGIYLPIFAADDFHRNTGRNIINPTAFVMVESDSTESALLREAIRAGRFYASTGPEIHVHRAGDEIVVDSTPVSRVEFFTNNVVTAGRVLEGEGITHATYKICPFERFVRVAVTDADGNAAWSHIIVL